MLNQYRRVHISVHEISLKKKLVYNIMYTKRKMVIKGVYTILYTLHRVKSIKNHCGSQPVKIIIFFNFTVNFNLNKYLISKIKDMLGTVLPNLSYFLEIKIWIIKLLLSLFFTILIIKNTLICIIIVLCTLYQLSFFLKS
jgi:hypothetical protein